MFFYYTIYVGDSDFILKTIVDDFSEHCLSAEFTLDGLTDDVHSVEYIYVGTYVVTDFEEVYCIIKRGELLGSEKVVHIPGIPIGLKALTAQDEEDIRTGILLKVDAIMIPGIRNVSFFNRVKYFVCECHHRLRLSHASTDVPPTDYVSF